MTPEIEDAIYSACQVTDKSPQPGRLHVADHPRATGTFRPDRTISTRRFKLRVRAFLGELDATMTVADLLAELNTPRSGD